MGVDVTGVPGIKPTDGMTAWRRDGTDLGNQSSPAFWSPRLQLLGARTDSCEGLHFDLGTSAGVAGGKQGVLCILGSELNSCGIPPLLLSGHK